MDEMPVPALDDRALEALLSGPRSSQSCFDWLLPFVEGLEEASSGPTPAVKPALAMLLAQGLSTEEVDLPATAASSVTAPARQAPGPPKWGRKVRLAQVLGAPMAKLAGLGMAAKAGLGLTLVAASTTAAAAAGVLPAPAQHAVATVVDAATPFTFPDAATQKAEPGASASAEATGASDGVAPVDGRAVKEKRTLPTSLPSGAQVGTVPSGTGTDAPPAKAAGAGADKGSTGLARATQTPAAGRAPTSVPAAAGPPVAPGSRASKGLDVANSTPAAGRVPTGVPPKTPASSSASAPGGKDLGAAGGTPAAGGKPGGSPGRPPKVSP